MTYICVDNLTIIGPDNGVLPGQHQAIIWTNAEIFLIGPLGRNFSENLIEILRVSYKKMRLKGSSTKWRPVCLGLNMLTSQVRVYWIHWGLNKRADTLTHWARKTHICVGNLTIIGSDNGLTPGRRQAIIWTNAGILLFGPSGTNFSDISIEIVTFSFKIMQLKASSVKWRPYCFGLNVLTDVIIYMICIWIEVSLEVCSSGSSWQVIIGSGNGLSPVEPEAITWINDGLVQHFEALMRWFYDTGMTV